MNKNNNAIYVCPMHSEIRRLNSGICPKCGMTLVKSEKLKIKNNESIYNKHRGHSLGMFAKKFWISLVLTIPIFFYSEIWLKIFGKFVLDFYGSEYVLLFLSSIIFFYGGWVFIAGAWRELKSKNPGMMTLISLAIITAYVYSIFAVLILKRENLFWELASLITIMLLGHWLEMRAVLSAQGALKELSKLLPDFAEVVSGSEIKNVNLSELKVGDEILIKPGTKVPADAVVVEGNSEINESIITGESKSVFKKEKSGIIAGTINGNGFLKARVLKIGTDTFLAGVMRLIEEAQSSKSRLQILSDKAAYYLTFIAVISGILTFFSWIVFSRSGFVFAVERLVAVLVIACPHALGLAIPLVASISTTMAASNGFLVKQRIALEAARKINIVLFDKTGTLTMGEYGVDEIKIFDKNQYQDLKIKIDENEILRLAASVDAKSEHFISKAIVAESKKRNLNLFETRDFKRIAGKGVSGIADNFEILVGGEAILGEAGISAISRDFKSEIDNLSKSGKTIIYVILNKNLLGVISLGDIIRDESREAVKKIKNLGIKVAMITGDSNDVASWVADELGIDIYFARVLPEEKAQIVKQIQENKFKNLKFEIKDFKQKIAVAMVGDGINDAPALAMADLGIAIGAGTNIAIESAGIILLKNDPRDIVKIIKLSRLTYAKMIQNLFWATGYNIVALPLAAGILASKGILFQPAYAAIFMSLSTIVVAINAIFLKRKILV